MLRVFCDDGTDGTGNSYTQSSIDVANAVIAFDMDTGARKWVTQALPDDGPAGLTMAELSDVQKDAISHRGRAARALAEWLRSRETAPEP